MLGWPATSRHSSFYWNCFWAHGSDSHLRILSTFCRAPQFGHRQRMRLLSWMTIRLAKGHASHRHRNIRTANIRPTNMLPSPAHERPINPQDRTFSIGKHIGRWVILAIMLVFTETRIVGCCRGTSTFRCVPSTASTFRPHHPNSYSGNAVVP
ncbi:hypothetical protein BS47DRAFT_366560 [Hydnum rufescens UP504]|uniref:Uncharacterized protein n=1 Tax=Hydnum rufescens UP504 TaxID=1448309 RepID=A0A9P6AJF2_9AGAM|nr:hypothetical protein BS47DRAFT_366560 [Hydnum rufescens UP504]